MRCDAAISNKAANHETSFIKDVIHRHRHGRVVTQGDHQCVLCMLAGREGAAKHTDATTGQKAAQTTSSTTEAGSDPRGHLGVTWGVYLCAGKPPLADIILSHPPELTRCDSVIGLAIPAMSGHTQCRGTASGDLHIGISGINRVLLS